jgi:DNA repair protein RecN (Recombination protein N)
MLLELNVRNLAIIEEASLAFGAGLNVITGETGAGKSLLIDALEFVLGGASDRDLIRVGSASTVVEAIFSIDDNPSAVRDISREGIEPDEEGSVILSREVKREGRTVSRVNGRAVPASVARKIGGALVDIHGQDTHLSLLDPQYQLELLDSFGALASQRDAVEAAVAEVERMRQSFQSIVSETRELEQRRDLLSFQVAEIDAASIKPSEEATLRLERNVLANAEAIQASCIAAYEALSGGGANASDLVGQAIQQLRQATNQAGGLAFQIDALESVASQLEEATRDIRTLGESAEANPIRLADLDDRIELIRRLKKKYGESEADVLSFAEKARLQLGLLEDSSDFQERLHADLTAAVRKAGMLAWELSQSRRQVALSIDSSVAPELAEVGLSGFHFKTEVRQLEAPAGLPGPDGTTFTYTARGIDEASFMLQTNPGEAMRPLAKIASGGETSRIFLALTNVLQTTFGVPTLVFDEVDAGIGGRTAQIIGRKLWAVGRQAQVLCVTHLPQIAAYADRHFRIEKSIHGDRAYAAAEVLGERHRITEIAAMLGTAEVASRERVAQEMLDGAARAKTRG